MNILAIDTSTDTLSVALSQSSKIIESFSLRTKNDHASHLMPTIVQVMESAKLLPEKLNKIVVGNGPGSYTGTRIGTTTAKSLAWSLNIPIYSISSLEAMAFSALADAKLICPFIDARRRAIYSGLYENENNYLLTKMPDSHIQVDGWLEQLNDLNEKIHFISPHLEIYQSTITEKLKENAVFHNIKKETFISESLLNLYKQHEKSNVHSVVPNYIRKTEAEIKLEQQIKGDKASG